jgi:hypothetical protein
MWGERVFWESHFVAMPEHKAVKKPGWRSKARVDF